MCVNPCCWFQSHAHYRRVWYGVCCVSTARIAGIFNKMQLDITMRLTSVKYVEEVSIAITSRCSESFVLYLLKLQAQNEAATSSPPFEDKLVHAQLTSEAWVVAHQLQEEMVFVDLFCRPQLSYPDGMPVVRCHAKVLQDLCFLPPAKKCLVRMLVTR